MIDLKDFISGMNSGYSAVDVSRKAFMDPVLIRCTRGSDNIVGFVNGYTLGICRVNFLAKETYSIGRDSCLLRLATGDLINEDEDHPLPMSVQNLGEIRARFIADEHIDAAARAMGNLIARRHLKLGLQMPFSTLVEQLRLDYVPFVDATAIERRMTMIFAEIMKALPNSTNHCTVLERWVRASMPIDPTQALDDKRRMEIVATRFSTKTSALLGCLLTAQKPTEEPMERHEPFDFRLRTNLLTGSVHVREHYIGHLPERDRVELLVATQQYLRARYEEQSDWVAAWKDSMSHELRPMVLLSGCKKNLLGTIEQKQYRDFRAWCMQFLPVLQAAPSTLRQHLYEALAQQAMDEILSAAPASDKLPLLMLVQPWFDVITPLCERH